MVNNRSHRCYVKQLYPKHWITGTSIEPFNAGEGFIIDYPDGGAWTSLWPCGTQEVVTCTSEFSFDDYPAFGGGDNRVLIAQITASGKLYGILNFNLRVSGDLESVVGFTFSTNPEDVFGCTNEAATNYDAAATLDDLSCVLPCTVALNVDNVNSPSCNGQNDAFIQVVAWGTRCGLLLPRCHRRHCTKLWQLRSTLCWHIRCLRDGCRRLCGFACC